MEEALHVRVHGPLAGSAREFVLHLSGLGYADTSAARHVRRLAAVSEWLDNHAVDASALNEVLVATMLDELHGQGRLAQARPASFGLLLRFLRECGVAPAPAPAESAPFDELLGDYRRYLQVERSLAPLSLPGYLGSAAWFLRQRCGDDPDRVRALSAADVGAFVLGVAEVRRPSSVNTVVVGVRSLLRWLYAIGLIDTPLGQATPWLARGAMGTLPRTLAEGQAAALLATCDGETLGGARNRAVLSVLVRLGLRAGEVAGLALDDIDWRRGEIDVAGKGGWRDPLPLPVDVGDALVAYLRRRGRREDQRKVFLQVRAPHGPMTMTSVRAVVRQACERAGVADTGTHRLRHGAAADMLRHGAPLAEIGQVLRHRDLATTAHYAKVDFATLATLARPWPGTGR